MTWNWSRQDKFWWTSKRGSRCQEWVISAQLYVHHSLIPTWMIKLGIRHSGKKERENTFWRTATDLINWIWKQVALEPRPAYGHLQNFLFSVIFHWIGIIGNGPAKVFFWINETQAFTQNRHNLCLMNFLRLPASLTEDGMDMEEWHHIKYWESLVPRIFSAIQIHDRIISCHEIAGNSNLKMVGRRIHCLSQVKKRANVGFSSNLVDFVVQLDVNSRSHFGPPNRDWQGERHEWDTCVTHVTGIN